MSESILSQPFTSRLHHMVRSKHWDQEDCPGWTCRTQVSRIYLLPLNPGHPSVLANNQVHTMTCINRLILQTTYCRILIKIRGKGILFPLQRLFFIISLLPFYALFLLFFFLVRYLRFLFCKGNSVEFKPIWLLTCFAHKAQPGESHFLVLGLVLHRTNVMRRSFS